MDQLHAMRVYLRVAELASFSQAADSLNLPKASISAAVQRLEAQLGVRLLHRTTRRVQMTQDGLVYYERCRDLVNDVDELQSLFQQESTGLRGRLRVDMSSGIARHVIAPRLPAFLALHPDLSMELSSTDRRVDLVREGFDCVLRVGVLGDTTLIARPLGRLRLINVASTDYVRRYGQPQSLDDLARHQLVHYLPAFGGKAAGFEYQDVSGQAVFVPMAGAITVNNADAYQACCLAGMGIIQAPEIGLRDLLARGELVEVLPDHLAAPMPVSLLYAHRRHLPRRVRVFMDWVATQMAPHLLP